MKTEAQDGLTKNGGTTMPFSLLTKLFGDSRMADIYSEQSNLELWFKVEVALASSQARHGAISHEAAEDIAKAAIAARSEASRVWDTAANVGYPILSVVRLLDSHAKSAGVGRVHLGATTQDIMDTAVAIQMRDATDLLEERLLVLGNALSFLVTEHKSTVMAGRTHAQQAVPISLGMKFSIVLEQVIRSWRRLEEERPRVAVVSLFGAAGTSAALGPGAADVRRTLAELLGLGHTEVPWHVARDGLYAQCANAVAAAEVAARFAREIIDLSRTEIGEVLEPSGAHRGASSTMPQKANPILSEAIVGFAISANSLMAGMGRTLEAGHERSAGEWQAEWHLIPQTMSLASSALLRAGELAQQLVVNTYAIERNLHADHGLLMAEAYMIALSDSMGREKAHDAVYAACAQTRRENTPLVDVLISSLGEKERTIVSELRPHDYIGQAEAICDIAAESWRAQVLSAKKKKEANE
jgi:3-carboxy-cis,cis-muconate cycloisomerase